MASSSGQFVDDLLLQIFPLVPLKSLARFKSVSKQWRSLISYNPRPVRALLVDCEKDLHLLPLDTNTNTCNHQSSFPFHHPNLALLQSCNGLLLFQTASAGPRQYHVYNPLTRQHDTLPVVFFESSIFGVTACLAYDPSTSPHYKLLCLCLRYIVIYSSKTTHWRRWDASSFKPGLQHIHIVHFFPQTRHELYWNGSVYYISSIARKRLYELYRFDVQRERMLEAPLPQDDDFKKSPLKRLVESWGRFYMLGVADAIGQELKVYEMERDHSGWRLKYHLHDFGRDLKLRFCHSGNDLKIRLGGGKIVCIPSDCYRVFFPAPEEGGEEEMWLVLTGDVTLVYRYGLGSKCVVSVNTLKPRHDRPPEYFSAHEFAESLSELPQHPDPSYIYDF